MIAYAALLGLSLWLNRADRKMLLLSVLVGGSFFMEVPNHSQLAFYSTCIAVEVVVAALALLLRTHASWAVAELCAVMVAGHVMGWSMDGHASLSPYKGIMLITEYLQIVVCILASRTALTRLKNT